MHRTARHGNHFSYVCQNNTFLFSRTALPSASTLAEDKRAVVSFSLSYISIQRVNALTTVHNNGSIVIILLNSPFKNNLPTHSFS